MSAARIGSLFSGYGGLDLGVSVVLGGRVVWHCEVEPAACRVLATRFPGVPNLGDIRHVDWSRLESVDVLLGGFPCQDVSAAGNRAGLRDGNRSGLWAEMAAAVDALRPRLVMVENVRGLLSAHAVRSSDDGAVGDLGCELCDLEDDGEPAVRALGAVLGDLADLGYDARWCCARASDVGAPHRRERVFIVAWPAENPDRAASHEWTRPAPGQAQGGGARADSGRRGGASVADPDSGGHGGWSDPDRVGAVAGPDANGTRQRKRARPVADSGSAHHWGPYEPAVQRWERVLGRAAPAPTEPGRDGAGRLSPRFVEWMMGLPDGWVTDIPGLSRNDQLTLLGNGVVPQQAAHALRHLLDIRCAAA